MKRSSAIFILSTIAWIASLHAQTGLPSKSPWLGVWTARLGDYGLVALKVQDRGDGKPSSIAVWWLVNEVRTSGLRIQDESLYVEFIDQMHAPMPGLALRMHDSQRLALIPYGVLPAPLDLVFQNAEFIRQADGFFWDQNFTYRTTPNEWGKWHDQGQLKPLPTAWPSTITVPLLHLFRHNDHLLHRVVVLPSLPESALSEAYTWTQNKPRWNGSPDFIQERIAENPNTSVSILSEAWNHPDNPQLWIAAAQNPRAPESWRAALIERILAASDQVKSRATWRGSGPPELYLRLMEVNPSIRQSIASNRSMPSVVYERLARDYAGESMTHLARNEAVPVGLLESIAQSASPEVQLHLISNPSLPPLTRTRVVHRITAQATPAQFARFVHDRDAPPEFLTRCSADLDALIRTYVANNLNTPELLLLTLAEDPSRSVADAARQSLGRRFPAAFAQHRATFSPLEARSADIPPSKQFETAAIQKDLPELKRLASYFAERDNLDQMLSLTARAVIRDGYRPEVMDFFIAQGYGRDSGSLAHLAGQCGGNRQWIEFFKSRGAFQKNYAGIAYREALNSTIPENLAGLIAAGIDPNQTDDENRTALQRAVLMHKLSALEALLRAGADPSAKDRQGRTALDYAVVLKFIPAIRLLDTNGRHAALIEAFVKEFPPAPESQFLGGWTNNRDGFYTVAIQLNADGSGRFGASVFGTLLAWREVSPKEAIAYLFNEKGEIERSMHIVLRFDEATASTLTLVPPKGETQKMIRSDRK